MRKCKNRKKFARILLLCYLLIFGLIAVVFTLVRTPIIQNIVAQKAAEYLSKELDTKVVIGKVDVDYLCNITLYDLEIQDKHNKPILKTEALKVGFKNYIKSENKIIFNKIALKNTNARIIKYKDEDRLNFDFIIKYFSGEKKTEKKSSSPKLVFESIDLENINFTYHIESSKNSNSPVDFNYLAISNLNFLATDLNFAGSNGNINIQHLNFTDRSGFKVRHLGGNIAISDNRIAAKSMKIITNKSILDLNLAFNFNNFACFNHFIDSVSFDATFNKSKLNTEDIAYFTNSLAGMSNNVSLKGHVSGPISDIRGKNMEICFPNKSKLNFDLAMKGLPYFDETKIDLNLNRSKVNITDISNFKLPNGQTLNLGNQLASIEKAELRAEFHGYINNFAADANIEFANGKIQTKLKSKGASPNQKYEGSVSFNNFDLAVIAGNNSMLGPTSGNINFDGKGINAKNFAINSEGQIQMLTFKNYKYSNIEFNGSVEKSAFNGRININDSNANLNFDGYIDFSKEQPTMDFTANIDNIFLNPLNFNRNDSLAFFNGNINISITGTDIDSIRGFAKLSDLKYTEGSKSIRSDFFNIHIEKNDSNSKSISIKSDIMDGNIDGIFYFKEISNVFDLYADIFMNNETSNVNKNTAFSYNFIFKNIDPILNIFAPTISTSKNTIVRGSLDSKKHYLRAEIAANEAGIGSTNIKNLSILGETFSNTIYVTIQSDQVNLTDSNSINQIVLNTVTQGKNTNFSLHWDNNQKVNKKEYSGDINGNIILSKNSPAIISFDESQLVLNDSIYHISDKSNIVIDSTCIWIKTFDLASNFQGIKIEGRISKDPMDVVQVSFDNVQTSTFNDLLKQYQLKTDGNVNGYILLGNFYSSFDFRSNIKIDNLNINDNKVGDANLICSWDRKRQAVYSDIWIEYQGNVGKNIPFKVEGYYDPNDSINPFDLNVKLDRFNLSLVEPYLKSFSSHLSGLCDGKINVKGNIDNPQVNGSINFRRTNIKIDYLNMYYSFAHTLSINNNLISMEDVTLFDMHGQKSVGNIIIKHNNFKDFYLDIALNSDKMQFLNTTAKDNNYFYGKAFASGLIKLYGPFNMINIEVMAKTNQGTVVSIPISNSGELSQNNFIDFVDNNFDTTTTIERKISSGGINLDLDLEVTPDAEIQIVFDPKVGDILKGSGSGLLKMSIDPNGELLMYGNIEIEKGEYLFTLENVINKKFLIDKGGSIKWSGDPYKGQMDLTAKYNLKTSLYELVSVADPSEQYKSKVPVSCLMLLKGDLLSPNISFGLDLPNSDENTKNIVNSLIPNAEEMNKQVFSLLILNSFFQASADSYSNPLSQGFGTTSTELLVNQFSNWMSQISKDFDINFNYSQGNEITTSQVEVMLSTQLFNDRIEIDGNLGVGGNQINNSISQNQQASTIVGDVSVEYKIDKEGRFRMKAFNRSNTIDLVTNDAPYTQGVAFFYRKEFNKIKELWINEKRKKK